MPKRRLTKNQKLYRDERRRVMNLFNRAAKKEGLNVRAKEIFRNIPDRITKKMIQELKNIRSGKMAMDLYRSLFENVGETVFDAKMDDFLSQFDGLRNQKATEFLYNFFRELCDTYDSEIVLQGIADSEAEGNEFYVQMSYYKEALQGYALKIVQKVKQLAGESDEIDPAFSRTLADLFEEMEDGWEFY